MKINKIEKIVLLLICIALSVGFVTIYQRMAIEKQYKTAEIVMDYNEMSKFSKSSDEDLEYWLKKFKVYGAQSVAIQEETINLLIESGYPLRAEIVSELIKNYNYENNYSHRIVSKIKEEEISLMDAIITTKDRSLFDYIMSGLKERYSEEFYESYIIDDEFYIVLKGSIEDLYYTPTEKVINSDGDGVYEMQKVKDSRMFNIGIGYDDEKIQLARSANLDVVLRPINYKADNEKLVDVYKASNERYNIKPRLYLVHGKDILGYPENEEKLLNYIKESKISPILVESATQREHLEQGGLNKLIEKSNYNSLRAFTMWDYIRQRYKYYNYEGAEEIENTMFRAITERNIRVIYFKPFFEEKIKYLTDEIEYEKTFTSLKNRLEEHNIKIGLAEPIKEFHIGAKRLSILAFGITLAAVLLFIKMFNIKNKHANYLYFLSILGAIIPLFMRSIAEKGFALIAAIVFSGLAIYYFMVKIKEVYNSKIELSNTSLMIKSTIVLAVSVIISLMGAVFVDSMLGDVKYFLEMDIFRGVKVAQLVPFLVFIVLYLIYFINKNNEDNIKSIINTTITILNKDIKIYYALLAGVIAVVGYIYISRTGHETNIQPSNIEMIFRNLLENKLLARPRTKEFLIAFPAIFAAMYTANKKYDLFTGIFMLLAAIGTSSVINTFSHIRTPIYLSFARTVTALGFGVIVGCILIVVLSFINKLHINIQERLK